MLFGGRKGISIGMITGIQASVDNKYVSGSGVGASSRAAHRAKAARASIPTNAVVYKIVPQSPTSALVSLVNGNVQVSWTAPTNVGDSAISSYTITSTPGNVIVKTINGITTTATFSGLTDGVTYTFTIVATNAAGNSASITSPSIIAYSLSSPPTSLVATPGNTSVSIAFTPPTNTGGSAITNYQYSTNGGSSFTAFSPADTTSPIAITGLTNGTTYSIQLKSVTVAGVGAASASVSATPATTPGAPTGLSTTPGNASLSIAFTPPTDNGGSSITNYQYSTNNGSTYTAFSPADTTSPVTITGLTNGTSYSVKLKAVNSIGAGTASSTVTDTPYTTPGAPTSLSATAGNQTATISFTAPASTGGSSITNYQYSTDGGSTFNAFSPVDTTSPITITGLTNGTTYSVQLKAVNAAGAGTASSSVSVTPIQYQTAGSLLFSANPQYLLLDQGITLSSGAYTVECWFYNNNKWSANDLDSPFQGIMGCTNGGSGTTGCLNLEFVNSTTILLDRNGIGNRQIYTLASAVSLNAWHHFVLVRNSSQIETVFIDGVKAITAIGGTNISGGQQTNAIDYYGKSDRIGYTYEGQWFGYMTNFRAVVGTAVYDPTAASITVPTAPLTAISGTRYLMLGADVTTDSAGVQTVTNPLNITQTTEYKPL
jgi:hypothetical protein